jgi:hypothetical protein
LDQKAIENGIKWAEEAVETLVDEIKKLIAGCQQQYDQRRIEYEEKRDRRKLRRRK